MQLVTRREAESLALELDGYTKYHTRNGIPVWDKTDKVAQVNFVKELTEKRGKPTYIVFVNKKKLIFAASSPQKGPFLTFSNSIKFSFKFKEGFIKISEWHAEKKTVFYVDPQQCARKIAYCAHHYLPKALNLKEVALKMQDLEAFPSFSVSYTAYNRHGMVVFGSTEAKEDVLLWAAPGDEKLQRLVCTKEVFKEQGTMTLRAQGRKFMFLCNITGDHYLNSEKAQDYHEELAIKDTLLVMENEGMYTQFGLDIQRVMARQIVRLQNDNKRIGL